METRRLTIVLPAADVARLRQLLRPGEGMNELLKRVLMERLYATTTKP